MNDYNPIDEFNLPPYQPETVKWLSEEVREVCGCDFPNIDHFQKHRAIIGISRDIISEIIHKGNSMRLIATPFADGKGMTDAFNLNLKMIHWDVKEIIDCFAGIFIGKNVKITSADFADFTANLDKALPMGVEPFWGFYICNDMPDDFAQIITVATKKQ